MAPALDADQCTIGWIAPLPLELTAAITLLGDHTTRQVPDDETLYHVGRIGDHWVVMVVCPMIGTVPTATVLANMRRSFRNIKHVLVVGIAGGVPCYGTDLEEQIVLGDVVVGYPRQGKGGVAHYEFGAWEGEKELRVSEHTLHPSSALLTAVNNLRASHHLPAGCRVPEFLRDMRTRLAPDKRPEYADPGTAHDHLFDDRYGHSDATRSCAEICKMSRSMGREDRGDKAQRDPDSPVIHYGTIGSANTLVLSSAKRNKLYNQHDIIGFEMESAGVMSSHQGLVIRGISDYADSHKNKRWQGYAAATAAAYAKEVLLLVPASRETASGPSVAAKEESFARDVFRNEGDGIMSINTGSGSHHSINITGSNQFGGGSFSGFSMPWNFAVPTQEPRK